LRWVDSVRREKRVVHCVGHSAVVKYGYSDATGEREAELIVPLLTPSHGDKVKPEKKGERGYPAQLGEIGFSPTWPLVPCVCTSLPFVGLGLDLSPRTRLVLLQQFHSLMSARRKIFSVCHKPASRSSLNSRQSDVRALVYHHGHMPPKTPMSRHTRILV
jgi:hypothetical protein